MKPLACVYACLLLFVLTNRALTQAIDPATYFPVSVGDRWSYHEAGTPNVIVVAQIVIRETMQIDGKAYFKYDGFWWGRDTVSGVIDGKVYYRYMGVDQVFYNLSASIGDTWQLSLPVITYQPTSFTAKLESRTDTVRVPAGTFTNCLRISFKAKGVIDADWTDWLAPNVGRVFHGTQIPSELRDALVKGVLYPGLTPVENGFAKSRFALIQNYPNPFNPSTTIRFDLPKASTVSLKIFNMLGQEIASLVDEHKVVGSYQVQWNASNVPSGIYFYRLQAGEYLETKRMILLK